MYIKNSNTSLYGATKFVLDANAPSGRKWEVRSLNDGTFDIVDRTANTNRLSLNSSGLFTFAGSITCGSRSVTCGSLIAGTGTFQTGNNNPTKPVAGAWLATSDIRIKQNIKPFCCGLPEVTQLCPVSYEFNENSDYYEQLAGQRFIGLVADDVQKAMPCCVSTGTSQKLGDLLMLDTTPITYALINSVKALVAEVEALRDRIDTLETELSAKVQRT